MKRCLLICLLFSNALFSQKVGDIPELIIGTWETTDSPLPSIFIVNAESMDLTFGRTHCIGKYKLSRRKLDTGCNGKEKLIFYVVSVNVSTLRLALNEKHGDVWVFKKVQISEK